MLNFFIVFSFIVFLESRGWYGNYYYFVCVFADPKFIMCLNQHQKKIIKRGNWRNIAHRLSNFFYNLTVIFVCMCLQITISSFVSRSTSESSIVSQCRAFLNIFIMCDCYWSIQFSIVLYLIPFKIFLWIGLNNLLLSLKYFYGLFGTVV
jgi:hypothetical protein